MMNDTTHRDDATSPRPADGVEEALSATRQSIPQPPTNERLDSDPGSTKLYETGEVESDTRTEFDARPVMSESDSTIAGTTDDLCGAMLEERYRVESILGEGAMGRVYRGRQVRLHREVAIKVPFSQYSQDPEFLGRFEREALTMAHCVHENIVAIYDVNVAKAEGQISYIAMEMIEGEQLDRYLEAEERNLTLAAVIDILRQLARGIDAAHRKNIIHRDIKPANLFVTLPQRVGKIMDFGIARVEMEEAFRTQEEVAVGTPAYMAPEQLMGKDVGSPADIFAFGATVYRLFARAYAFDATNSTGMIMQRINKDPIGLRERNANWPKGVEKALLRAMSREADRRQPTAGMLIDEVEEALRPEHLKLPFSEFFEPGAVDVESTGVWERARAQAAGWWGSAGVKARSAVVAAAALALIALSSFAALALMDRDPDPELVRNNRDNNPSQSVDLNENRMIAPPDPNKGAPVVVPENPIDFDTLDPSEVTSATIAALTDQERERRVIAALNVERERDNAEKIPPTPGNVGVGVTTLGNGGWTSGVGASGGLNIGTAYNGNITTGSRVVAANNHDWNNIGTRVSTGTLISTNVGVLRPPKNGVGNANSLLGNGASAQPQPKADPEAEPAQNPETARNHHALALDELIRSVQADPKLGADDIAFIVNTKIKEDTLYAKIRKPIFYGEWSTARISLAQVEPAQADAFIRQMRGVADSHPDYSVILGFETPKDGRQIVGDTRAVLDLRFSVKLQKLDGLNPETEYTVDPFVIPVVFEKAGKEWMPATWFTLPE